MPLGEIVGELVFRTLVEILFGGVMYWTGFVLINVLTLGQVKLAPFSTLHQKNRKKGKRFQMDWSIWLHGKTTSRGKTCPKMLKADFVLLCGMVFYVALGFGLYWLFA